MGIFSNCFSQTWSLKLDPNGKFASEFPEIPTLFKDTTGNNFKTTLYCKPKGVDNNLYYSISYVDFLNSDFHSDSIDKIESMLDSTQFDNLNKYSLIPYTVRPLASSGYPGKEFRYQSSDAKLLVRIQVILVKNRLYQLRVDTSPDKKYNLSINKFFDAFKLVNTPPNIPSYLNIPDDEEIADRPFVADFRGITQNKVAFLDLLGKNIPLVLEVNQKVNSSSGVIVFLIVGYTKVSNDDILLSSASWLEPKKGEIVQGQFVDRNIQTKFKEMDALKSYGYIDVRGSHIKSQWLRFVDNRGYLFMLQISYMDKLADDNIEIKSFFDSFELKEKVNK